MEKRLRTNLFLAGTVILLALLAWLMPGPNEPQMYALFGPDERLEEIRVLQSGELQLGLQQHDDEWRVTAPVNLPADSFHLAALLDLLRESTPRRYAVEDAQLQELGLHDPAWTMEVNGVEIAVGDSAAIGNRQYVMKGEHIYLVNELLGYRLKRPPWDYVSKRVLPEGRIVTLALPTGVRIEREGPAWKTVPDEAFASSDVVQGVVTAWQNATAIRVMPAASVPRDGEVLVEFEDGRRLQFGVERRENELLLSRDTPAVTYVLPAAATGELLEHTANAE